VAEIAQLETLYESDVVGLVVIKSLITQIDWKDVKLQQKDQYRIQYLYQRVVQLSAQPNFPSMICQAFADAPPGDSFFQLFAKTLKLTLPQQVSVALGLTHSLNIDLKVMANDFLKGALPMLTKLDEKFTDYFSHELLVYLQTVEFPEKDTVIESLRRASNLSQLPMVLVHPDQNDLKRNFKRENRAKQAPYLQELAKSFSPADVMSDLGYISCASAENLKKVLHQFPLPLSASSIAEVIGMMANSVGVTDTDSSCGLLHSEFGFSESATPATCWDIDVFINVIQEMCINLSWKAVLEQLDYPDYYLRDEQGFRLLLDISSRVSSGFAIADIVLRRWKNTGGQLSFLVVAMTVPSDLFCFPPTKELMTLLESLPSITETPNPNLYSIPCLATLLRLASENVTFYAKIYDILRSGVKNSPTVLLLGISLVAQDSPLKQKLMEELLANFLPANSCPHSLAIISCLWPSYEPLIIHTMGLMYKESAASLSRILDIAQELNCLKALLDAYPLSTFSIDLAALASKRDNLNLVRWLEEMINQHGAIFCSLAISFLKERISKQRQTQPQQQQEGQDETQPQPSFALLTFETVHIFLEQFKGVITMLPNDCRAELNQLVSLLDSEVFPSDIEKEANAIFSRIYDGQIGMSDIISLLQAFKTSNDPRERKIFQCMIRSLYEEYPHIPKYPEKELHITGVLFGSLIQFQLVAYIPLVLALRYILEALKHPIQAKIFKFGLYALEQFASRLHEWPQYCSHLHSIVNIQAVHPPLYRHIENILVHYSSNGPILNLSTEFASKDDEPFEYQGEQAYGHQANPEDSNDGSNSRPSLGQPLPPLELSNTPYSLRVMDPARAMLGGAVSVPDGVEDNSSLITNVASPELKPAGNPDNITGRSEGGNAFIDAYEDRVTRGHSGPLLLQPDTTTTTAVEEEEPEEVPSEEDFYGHALDISTLLCSQFSVVEPDEDTVDNVHFIFNNVAPQNMAQKAEDLKEAIGEEHFDYLAQYIVVKRASLEENFHGLYCRFIRLLDEPLLSKKVIRHTATAIKALLNSRRTRTDAGQKSLLRNLGAWLGLCTIASDIPLKHTDISLKDCLLEAYDKGSLVAVVPFVSRVLQQGRKSQWFRPPNPWVMAILRLMVELYKVAHIIEEIKFEVEILTSAFEIEISAITPSTLLKGRKAFAGPGLITDFDSVPAEEQPDRQAKFHVQYVHINPAITLFRQQPHLKKAVYVAINRAIQDIIAPVVDRLVMIASITTKEVTTKDFAMEADELKMLRSAANMAQSLAGNLASITCKDPLRVAITNNLRSALGGGAPGKPIPAPLEHAIQTVVTDNLELACTVVQKAAAEAATIHVEEQLADAAQSRRNHRESRGRRMPYYDIKVVGSSGHAFVSTLPDFLRPRLGGLSSEQLQVYEDFLLLPLGGVPSSPSSGQMPTNLSGNYAVQGVSSTQLPPSPSGGPTDVSLESSIKRLDHFLLDLITSLSTLQNVRSLSELSLEHTVVRMFSRVASILLSCPAKYELAIYTAHAVFPKLFERMLLHREAFLTIIDVLVNVVPTVRPKITELLIYSEPSHKYHKEVVPALLHYNMLSLQDYDAELADSVARRDPLAIDFAHFLVQNMVKAMALSPVDLILTLEILLKSNPADMELRSLVESVRGASQYFADPGYPTNGNQTQFNNTLPTNQIPSGVAPGGPATINSDINLSLEHQVLMLFDEWTAVFRRNDPQHVIALLRQLQLIGFYNSKELSEVDMAVYQVFIEAAIYQCLTAPREAEAPFEKDDMFGSVSDPTPGGYSPVQAEDERPMRETSPLNYKPIEAAGKILYQMVRYAPERLYALNAILSVLGKVMHHNSPQEFDQRPYFKLYFVLFMEFNQPDVVLEPINTEIFLQFKDILHAFRPSVYPAFAFSWLELISHRYFMPQLLRETITWSFAKDLLVDLFEFLEPWLRAVHMSPPIKLLYQGTLRILLVLLHDFPEFLCDYHLTFCDVIPPTCIQLRNLILSAFPQTMKLPDPFMSHESIPEIKDPPKIRSSFIDILVETGLKPPLDAYLSTCTPTAFLVTLLSKLLYVPRDPTLLEDGSLAPSSIMNHGTKYNIYLMNSLVSYLGICALSELPTDYAPQAVMEIFTFLAVQLDKEGRYLFFNAIANQLRYPNNQTHYFSCVLLYLFAESGNQEIVQEQITRVLVERLIVHRPHPWGLLITFFELIQNPRYNFWARGFTRCAPEIERLFRQIGSHIAQHKNETS